MNEPTFFDEVSPIAMTAEQSFKLRRRPVVLLLATRRDEFPAMRRRVPDGMGIVEVLASQPEKLMGLEVDSAMSSATFDANLTPHMAALVRSRIR